MLLKELIVGLQDLYDSHTEEYKESMGEPRICIEAFILRDEGFNYVGISEGIQLAHTSDGAYSILMWDAGEKGQKNYAGAPPH